MLKENLFLRFEFVRLKIKPHRDYGSVSLTFARLCRSTTFSVNAERPHDSTYSKWPFKRAYFRTISSTLAPRGGESHRGCVARARRNIPSRAGHTNRPRYYERKQGVLILARLFGTCVTEGMEL